MAKKKNYPTTVYSVGYEQRVISDNNPDGPSELPNDNLNGCLYSGNKVFFPDIVSKGESPEAPDVNTITANGVSKSRGQDKGRQYNWGTGTDGHWNEGGEWVGANLTGM